jgi:3-phenylpropionate/trans-cinnamate dioxygenase ferredoxin subunit
MAAMPPEPFAYPEHLAAPGTRGAPFRPLIRAADLPVGTMRRVTEGDLDLLVAHLDVGVVVVDDRCPHMSAPLSIGQLEGCVVACPLHDGRFDLCSGGPERLPNTGGLDPDGRPFSPWSRPGREPKPDVPGPKAEARRMTRVRRFRYYPVRVIDGVVEARLPV